MEDLSGASVEILRRACCCVGLGWVLETPSAESHKCAAGIANGKDYAVAEGVVTPARWIFALSTEVNIQEDLVIVAFAKSCPQALPTIGSNANLEALQRSRFERSLVRPSNQSVRYILSRRTIKLERSF